MTHDEGDSVGLIILKRIQDGKVKLQIDNHFILNGGLYMPLQQPKYFQYAMLNDFTGFAL